MIRLVTSTLGSAVLTGLSRVNDIYVGEFIYGTGIPAATSVLSVNPSLMQVTMNNPATVNRTGTVEFTSCSEGVYMDRMAALADVQEIVNERGGPIQFILRAETNVTRDNYNSIATRAQATAYNLRAFPIEMNPSTKQLEKAGIKERQDCIVYTAMKDWMDAGVDVTILEMIRSTVKLNGSVYQVKEIGYFSQYNDTFLYLTIGLSKS